MDKALRIIAFLLLCTTGHLLSAQQILGQIMQPAPVSSGGTGTISFIQGGKGTSGASAQCVNGGTAVHLDCTFASNATAGNMIVVVGRVQVTGAGATLAITNAVGTCTWNAVVNPTARSTAGAGSTQHTMAMFYCIVPSTGGVEFDAIWSGGGAASYSDLGYNEYHSTTGFKSSGTVDQTTNSCSGGNCAAKSTAVTTGTTSAITNTNDLVVCGIASWDTAPTWPSISGYTNETASTGTELALYDKGTTSNATQVCAFTGASDAWIGVIGAFKTL